MSSPPASAVKRNRLSSSRISLSGHRKSLQGGGQSALPRPTSGSFSVPNRNVSNQPTYDFLAGGSNNENAPPVKRTLLRQSQGPRLDPGNDENLRAKLNTLDYEIKNLQQERGLLILQHEKELRDAQIKAEADFKRAQAAESASRKASHKVDAIAQELRDTQNQAINEKASLEKRVRDLQDQNAAQREEFQDEHARLTDQGRQFEHQIKDVEAKRVALEETVEKMKDDMLRLTQHLEATQQRLTMRDGEAANLEAQIVELKSHAGDGQAFSVLQRELSDQVAHIRKLESTNREQLAELRRLRDAHKSVEVVEEQKRSLETELQVLQDVHRQLGEAQIQKEILEDEKRSWTSLLETEGRQLEFDSPEAVVRALVQERLQIASFMDRVGKAEAELSEKDQVITSLDVEKTALKNELDKLRTEGQREGTGGKVYKRLERQRVLAVKEVEYLRAQLKTFDTEETVLMSNTNFDVQKTQQITQLEALVDQYRSEIQMLHAELSKLETSQAQQPPNSPRGLKRPAEDDSQSPQLGPVLRKNANLQRALEKSTSTASLLATELSATKSQLKHLQAQSRTRILSLNSNPNTDFEALKLSSLNTLRKENRDLLAQLRGASASECVDQVPKSVVESLELDITELNRQLAEKEKRMRRLREIWTDKAAEFRDVIASVLGWKINFLPNGKVKVSSTYRAQRGSGAESAGAEGGAGAEGEDDYVLFDGEQGTMKISGGPAGAFAQEIAQLVEFWVKSKKQIPCFLAAMTLEFYEKGAGGG